MNFENIKIGTFQFIMKWLERNAHLYKPSDVGKNKFYVLKISSNNMIDDVLLWFYHFNNVFSPTHQFAENFTNILWNLSLYFQIFERESSSETIFIHRVVENRVYMDLNLEKPADQVWTPYNVSTNDYYMMKIGFNSLRPI